MLDKSIDVTNDGFTRCFWWDLSPNNQLFVAYYGGAGADSHSEGDQFFSIPVVVFDYVCMCVKKCL